MSPARVALGAVVLFAMVRFFLTPTWPCAFVVLGALVVAVGAHVVSDKRHEAELARIAEVAQTAATDARSALEQGHDLRRVAAEGLAGLSERVDRVERLRALGG